MKDNFFKKYGQSLIIPTVVMIIICLVVTLALSVSNLITAPKIAEIEQETEKQSLLTVMKARDYDEKEFKAESETVSYYEAKSGDEIIGYIFTVAEKGYGGDVKVMTAVTPDLTVKAVKVIDVSNETVGLGKNTAEEKFSSQFSGKTEGISVLKTGADQSKNQIDAVTGATISSKAVTKAVNRSVDYAKKIVSADDNESKEGDSK